MLMLFPVIRDGPTVQLDVDSEVSHVMASVREPAQMSDAPVFLGGAPGQSPLMMFKDSGHSLNTHFIGVDIGRPALAWWNTGRDGQDPFFQDFMIFYFKIMVKKIFYFMIMIYIYIHIHFIFVI